MLKTLEWAAIIAAAVLIVSLVGVSYLSSPPPSNPREQQSATQAEHENQAEKQHSLRGFVRFLFPDGIAVFTFFLVLATILLGWAAVVQIGFLNRAEAIATESANAAKKAAEVAEGALVSVQRAFVDPDVGIGTEAVRQADSPMVTDHWEFFVRWNNNGPTRAMDVRQKIGVTSDPNFIIPVDEIRSKDPFVIGPQAHIFTDRVSLSLEQARMAFNKKQRFYLWGWIEYNDVFPNTKPHYTELFAEVTFRADPSLPNRDNVDITVRGPRNRGN